MSDFLTQIKEKLNQIKLEKDSAGDLFKKYFYEIDYFVRYYLDLHGNYISNHLKSKNTKTSFYTPYSSPGVYLSEKELKIDLTFHFSLYSMTGKGPDNKLLSFPGLFYELFLPENIKVKFELEEVLGQHLMEVLRTLIPERDIAFFNDVHTQTKMKELGNIGYDKLKLNERHVGPILTRLTDDDNIIIIKTNLIGIFLEKTKLSDSYVRISPLDIRFPKI